MEPNIYNAHIWVVIRVDASRRHGPHHEYDGHVTRQSGGEVHGVVEAACVREAWHTHIAEEG